MKGYKPIIAICSLICVMLLIFDSKTAIDGTKIGTDLCIRTVIPSLFPFLILVTAFTSSLSNLDSPVLKQLARFVGIPEQAVAVLVPAFLGGYPVGAKAVTDLYWYGILSKREAERMLAFCSNAGPSFLFGMISSLFPTRDMIWKLWGIQILSALITSRLFPALPVECLPTQHQVKEKRLDIMGSAVHAMASVCGWVILFRTLITVLNKWLLWLFPTWIQVTLIGILELSNGCYELHSIPSVSARFLLSCGMLSFGGICVLLQTVSVTKGLSLRNYVIGKSLQAALSVLMGWIVVSANGKILVLFSIFFLFIPVLFQNRCSNPRTYPV